MEHFLELAARDLYNNYSDPKTGLSDITVVFPNRRARLFFDEYLSRLADRPIWSPRYVTIEELFHSRSKLRVADRYQLVAMLYKAYCRVTGSGESLDSFWSWGELMLADFEDIDRNMANTSQLFSVLHELKDMEADHSFLTTEQEEALNQFFEGLKRTKDTDLEKRYMDIWAALGNIYNQFRQDLQAQGLAYDGMLQRQVAMELDAASFPSRHYAFIGFNGLDAAEKRLFQVLQASGKAIFYWDYDIEYTDNTLAEAGLYLRDNIREFPGRLGREHYDCLSKPKNIAIVQTKTDCAQASYIGTWLSGLESRPDKDCAIVLADSDLLQPVLHSIPPGTTDALNITMGYPLTSTQIYSLTWALLDLQTCAMKENGRTSLDRCCRLLDNTLLSTLEPDAARLRKQLVDDRAFHATLDRVAAMTDSTLLKKVFHLCSSQIELLDWLMSMLETVIPSITDNPDDTLLKPLNQESLFRTYTGIQRLHSLVADGILDIGTDTLCRLLGKLLKNLTVPFHGEPVVGMQVMGLIETRNLDFKNVLLLSSQEGALPGSMNQQSFIPHNLRVAFGLTTMKQKSAVAAYNFQHLIQRAENVTFVYNGNPDAAGSGSGQISRYLLQLETRNAGIRHEILEPELDGTSPTEMEIRKTPELISRLAARYDISSQDSDKFLSPSALNTYLECGAKFWFKYVAGLKERQDSLEDIDQALFGTLFHLSAQLAYDEMAAAGDGMITKESLKALLDRKGGIEGYVQRAFDRELFNSQDGLRHVDPQDYSGTQILNYEVICRYLRQVLKMDMECYAPFRYLKSETDEFSQVIEVPCGVTESGKVKVKLGGYIDRMDSKDGTVRIVDYKTGSPKVVPRTVEALFEFGKHSRNYHVFQTFYYAMLVSRSPEYADESVAPMLLYVRNTSKPSERNLYMEMDGTPVKNFAAGPMDEYSARLEELISGIFDPEQPLRLTADSDSCKYCEFYSLCKSRLDPKH